MDKKINEALEYFGLGAPLRDEKSLMDIKIVRNNSTAYTDRHRGQWFRPEWNFSDIQNAQDTDSLFARAVEIKSTKFLLGGWEFVSENTKVSEYIRKRVQQIEFATNTPFPMTMYQIASDILRFSNAMLVLVRDPVNSGGKSYSLGGVDFKPIAGIFPLPFETLEFKTKSNGSLERVRQVVPGATKNPEFSAKDLIHFHMNKRPGFATGTPVMFSVLEDISLLRSLEENVEELIYCNLFPLFHYKVGSDKYPERVNPKSGLRESEVVAQTLEYMPSSGVYISDWRHTVEAIGSEGRALRIDFYLEYFKKRVMAGLGVSPVDFGDGGTSNRSTAQTQSKALTESIESLQRIMKTFIDFYLIKPLLLESNFSFDVFAPENIVEIKFGKIDLAEQVLMENSAVQLWLNNSITHDELRKRINERPLKPEQEARLFSRLFPNPVPATANLPGAPGSTLSQNQKGIQAQPKVSKTKDRSEGILVDNIMEQWMLLRSELVKFTNGNSPGGITEKLIETWGDQATDRLYALLKDRFDSGFSSTNRDRWNYNLDKETIALKIYAGLLINNLTKTLIDKVNKLHNEGVSLVTIFDSLMWRVRLLQKDTLSKAYNFGRALGYLLDEGSSIKISSTSESCEECKKHNGLIFTRDNFTLEAVPPSTKYGHPGCQCMVEKNG